MSNLTKVRNKYYNPDNEGDSEFAWEPGVHPKPAQTAAPVATPTPVQAPQDAFNYDPNNQKYTTERRLTPQAQGLRDYFSGVPTGNFNFGDSDYYDYPIQNPAWSPTEYRANQGIQFDPTTGIVRQNLGLSPEQLQASAQYRDPSVQQLLGAGNAASVTPETQSILDNLPATLTDQQASAFYNQTGFLPQGLPQNQYNWWKGRGTDFNDPISGGAGFWRDSQASGDITNLKEAFVKSNPYLFTDVPAPTGPVQGIVNSGVGNLLAPFVQSSLFDATDPGLIDALQQIADSTITNRRQVPENLPDAAPVVQQEAAPQAQAPDPTIPQEAPAPVFDSRLGQYVQREAPHPQLGEQAPEKIEQPYETPTAQLFSPPPAIAPPTPALGSPNVQQETPALQQFNSTPDPSAPYTRNVIPFLGDYTKYGQPDGAPSHRFFGSSGLDFDGQKVTPPRAAVSTAVNDVPASPIVSPQTVPAVAGVVQGALAANSASVFNPPGTGLGGAQLTPLDIGGSFFGSSATSDNAFANLPQGDDPLMGAGGTALSLVPGFGPIGTALSLANRYNRGTAEQAKYESAGLANDGAFLSGATGGLSDFLTGNPTSGGIGGYNEPGQGGYAGFANFLDPGVSGPARAQASTQIPGYRKPPSIDPTAALNNAGWSSFLQGLPAGAAGSLIVGGPSAAATANVFGPAVTTGISNAFLPPAPPPAPAFSAPAGIF